MSHPASRAALLAGLPPEPDAAALFPDIRRQVDASHRKLVVIDDDPTGVQTVHDVALFLRWDKATLLEAVRREPRLFFLLTNSRSLPVEEAMRTNAETARLLAEVSRETGIKLVIASRSDSTLRGHYPAELLASQEGLGDACDGHLLVPAFFEGGRLTIGDTHYVAMPDATSDALVPASETSFAQDRVFGYKTAFLPAWAEEKSGGQIKQAQVVSLSLELIRRGGPQAVADKLAGINGGVPVVVNAAGYGDLSVVVLGTLLAEAAARRFLYRTAASFVRLRGAVEPRPLLSALEVLGVNDSTNLGCGGLVVVGSHVSGSSAQLEALLDMHGVQGMELEVERVAVVGDEEVAAVGRAIGQSLDAALDAKRVAVLYTSRKLVTGNSAAETLAMGRRVSAALAAALQAMTVRPRFIVAKGGITSQVMAQHGLGADRARAIGQILPGVPVWRLESGSDLRFPGVPYVVFPGNVGGPDSLADVVRRLAPGISDDLKA